MNTLIEIGTYEAKTHLSGFLHKVQAGSAFRITQRGEPVANLIPYEASERKNAAQAASQMRQFMQNNRSVQCVDIKALIEEVRD